MVHAHTPLERHTVSTQLYPKLLGNARCLMWLLLPSALAVLVTTSDISEQPWRERGMDLHVAANICLTFC